MNLQEICTQTSHCQEKTPVGSEQGGNVWAIGGAEPALWLNVVDASAFLLNEIRIQKTSLYC